MSHERALIITDGGVGGLLACWAEGVVRAGLIAAAGRRTDERGTGSKARADDSRPVAWLAPLPLPARSRRQEAALRHAELCSLLSVVERPADSVEREVAGGLGDAEVVLNDVVGGPGATRLLLAAAEDAVRLGIWRIVWPVHLGDGSQQGLAEAEALDRVTGVFERALLIGQLASIDLAESLRARGGLAAARAVAIETPYLDFTDAQMMELAIDMDCPVAAESGAWVCQREGGAAARQAGWPGCGACASCVRWRRALGVAGGTAGGGVAGVVLEAGV